MGYSQEKEKERGTRKKKKKKGVQRTKRPGPSSLKGLIFPIRINHLPTSTRASIAQGEVGERHPICGILDCISPGERHIVTTVEGPGSINSFNREQVPKAAKNLGADA